MLRFNSFFKIVAILFLFTIFSFSAVGIVKAQTAILHEYFEDNLTLDNYFINDSNYDNAGLRFPDYLPPGWKEADFGNDDCTSMWQIHARYATIPDSYIYHSCPWSMRGSDPRANNWEASFLYTPQYNYGSTTPYNISFYVGKYGNGTCKLEVGTLPSYTCSRYGAGYVTLASYTISNNLTGIYFGGSCGGAPSSTPGWQLININNKIIPAGHKFIVFVVYGCTTADTHVHLDDVKIEALTPTPTPSFDFSVSVDPTSGLVNQGGSVSTKTTVTLISGATQPVTFSISGLPSETSASFSPTNCSPTCSSTLKINTSTTTPNGTYPINICGTGGGLTRCVIYQLTVGAPSFDFSVSVNPTSGSVNQGDSALTMVNVVLTAGSSQPVTLSASGLPSGASSSFSVSTCSPPCTPTLTINTSPFTPTGTFSINICGVGGGLTRCAPYQLTVGTAFFDFSVSVNPTSGLIDQGDSILTTVTVSLTAGATQSVTLSASGLPSGASASFGHTSCNPTCSSTLTISTATSTPTGTFSINICGVGGGLTRCAPYQLTVNTVVESILPPDVTTNPAADVELNSATLNGTLNSLGYDPVVCTHCKCIVWFEYKKKTDTTWTTVCEKEMTKTDTFSCSISELTPNTNYVFKAFAKNGGSW
jgi:hypothetical protein